MRTEQLSQEGLNKSAVYLGVFWVQIWYMLAAFITFSFLDIRMHFFFLLTGEVAMSLYIYIYMELIHYPLVSFSAFAFPFLQMLLNL